MPGQVERVMKHVESSQFSWAVHGTTVLELRARGSNLGRPAIWGRVGKCPALDV